MPFDGIDFYGSQSVKLMDAEAEAVYMRLLWEEWANGSLPEDPALIQHLLPAKFHKRWRVIWPQLEPKFPVIDGVRRNPRAVAERAKTDAMLDRKRHGAIKTNAARWNSVERSLSDSLSDTSSDRSATVSDVAQRSPLTQTQTQTETEEIQSPPSPLAGGANAATDPGNEPPGPQPEPRPKRPRRKPAEPWADVLERPEFAPLRESEPFVFGWNSWVEHCREAGSNAQEPQGQRAVAMFREAVRVGPAKYAAALEQAIASGWKAPHVAALERDSASRAGPIPNAAQRNFDSLREQAERLFGKETA
jgi:hypothetical protein